MNRSISVFLIYSQAFVRNALRVTLDSQTGINVVGEADCGESAIRQIRLLKPRIVLCDSVFEGFSGVELASRISRSQPETRVLIVSQNLRGPLPGRVMEAGASGYLSSECSVDEMSRAIVRVARGEIYLSRTVAQAMALHRSTARSLVSLLSPRELEVGMMLVQGYRPQEIALHLSLSVKTVSTHKARLFAKLNVTNVPKLVAVFREEGLDSVPLD